MTTPRQGRIGTLLDHGRIGRHEAHIGGYGIRDVDQPVRKVALDVRLFDEFNAANERARAEHYRNLRRRT